MNIPPVLFLIFNRPDTTRLVFERIREAKPAKLFIAADGPRSGKEGEAELCEQTRKLILDGIDWPCEIRTLFREKNLGSNQAGWSAINWFFEQVEEGIILEDDCLPDLSFFQFCGELLDQYRVDDRIMMICGDNFQPVRRGNGSYFFSRCTHIWGWATWRRAWREFDPVIYEWPDFRARGELSSILPKSTVKQVEKMYIGNFNGKTFIHYDTQWFFTCLARHGLCIMPAINLVTNIGSTGTHMKVYDPYINRPSGAMAFPLQHPSTIQPDRDADNYTLSCVYLRSGIQAVFLIVGYLWRILRKTPMRLPSAVGAVCVNLLTEISTRRRQRAEKRRNQGASQ